MATTTSIADRTVLLDTHAWVWSVEGDTTRIGRRARQLLARAESRLALRVSPVSIFEVAALHAAGRIHLASDPDHWIADALSAPGVRVAEVTPGIAIEAGAIPRTSLADPMDRLLVATARHLGATLLTADTRMLDYAAAHPGIRAADASR